MKSVFVVAFVASSVIAISGLAHAQKPADSSARAAVTKPDQTRANETAQINGVIKSVNKERGVMVVSGSNGAEYSLPLTKGLGDSADLVPGKKVTIEVNVSFKPLKVGVVVTF